MKKLIILFLILNINANSQSIIDYKKYKIDTTRNEIGNFKLVRLFEYNDSLLTKDKLYGNVKEFINKTYVFGKHVKIYEDRENGKFYFETVTKKLMFNNPMTSCNGGYFKYIMTVYVKEKKVKIVIDNIIHYKGECPFEAIDGSDFGDNFPRKWDRIAKKYDAKQYQEMKYQAFEEFLIVINYLDKFSSVKKDDGDF